MPAFRQILKKGNPRLTANREMVAPPLLQPALSRKVAVALFMKYGHDQRGEMPYEMFARRLFMGEAQTLSAEGCRKGAFRPKEGVRGWRWTGPSTGPLHPFEKADSSRFPSTRTWQAASGGCRAQIRPSKNQPRLVAKRVSARVAHHVAFLCCRCLLLPPLRPDQVPDLPLVRLRARGLGGGSRGGVQTLGVHRVRASAASSTRPHRAHALRWDRVGLGPPVCARGGASSPPRLAAIGPIARGTTGRATQTHCLCDLPCVGRFSLFAPRATGPHASAPCHPTRPRGPDLPGSCKYGIGIMMPTFLAAGAGTVLAVRPWCWCWHCSPMGA